jgi:hypothetical protein
MAVLIARFERFDFAFEGANPITQLGIVGAWGGARHENLPSKRMLG